jgi:hypothetical protein
MPKKKEANRLSFLLDFYIGQIAENHFIVDDVG